MNTDISFICDLHAVETTSKMENIVQQPITPPSTPCKNIKSIQFPATKSVKRKLIDKPMRKQEVDKDPLEIGVGKYIKLSTYKHKPYVNIREYATSINGKLYPTKKELC